MRQLLDDDVRRRILDIMPVALTVGSGRVRLQVESRYFMGPDGLGIESMERHRMVLDLVVALAARAEANAADPVEPGTSAREVHAVVEDVEVVLLKR